MIKAKIEFESPINVEGSWGSRPVADKAKSSMEFVPNRAHDGGNIEWIIDYPDGSDDVVEIGIWAAHDRLTDYDGSMSLPAQAVTLLRKAGIVVPEDFVD